MGSRGHYTLRYSQSLARSNCASTPGKMFDATCWRCPTHRHRPCPPRVAAPVPPRMSRSDATATSSSTYTERLVVTSLSSDEGHEIDDDVDASVVDGADRFDATPWPSKGRRRRAATYGVRLESVQRTIVAGLHQSLASPYGILRVFENLLTRHGAVRISLQVHHKATTTLSSSYGPFLGDRSKSEDPEGDNYWLRSASASSVSESGPSGVSVHVDFRVDGSDRHALKDPKAQRHAKLARDQAMRQILSELHARRILVAPILAWERERCRPSGTRRGFNPGRS
jgi:hypothetical protein